MSTSILSSIDPWSFGLISIALYLFYAFSSSIYDVYYGPLSQIPGPKLRAFSKFPSIITLMKGCETETYPELHDKYGPVVRIGPREISYAAGAEAWKEIYGFKSQVTKDPAFYDTSLNRVASIFEADREGHARHRKVLTHSFADKTLRDVEPLLKGWVGKMLDRFRGPGGTPIDVVGLYNCTTFDIMGDIAFATDLGMLSSGQVSHSVRLIFQNLKNSALVRGMSNIHPIFRWFFKDIVFEYGPVKAQRVQHWNYTKEAVDNRLRSPPSEGRRDLWTKVVETAKTPAGLSLEEQYSNASGFMIAGTETTATALSGITFSLLKNPQYLSQLTAEVRTAFQTYEDINLDQLARLPYLQAIIQEGLRVYPPVPSLLPRTVPVGGVTILDDFIPGGTWVGVHQLATYRRESNFKNARQFRPERWLGDPEYQNDQRSAFEPFSVGPRNCLGKNLAWHEMRLMLASTVLSFDLELCEESRDWIGQKIFLLWDKPELFCKLTPAKR
jgi:cytochrome P450